MRNLVASLMALVTVGCLTFGGTALNAATITVDVREVTPGGETFDLTGEWGTLDWAYSHGGEVNEKAGADLISTPLPTGMTGDKNPDYQFSFTDGTDPESGTISESGWINDDWSGTVTAPSAAPFTIYAWGTVFRGVAEFTATVGGVSDSATYELDHNDRDPGALFTINVNPDNAGDTVDLSYVLTESYATWSAAGFTAVSVIPEPTSLALLGLGLMALTLRRGRRR